MFCNAASSLSSLGPSLIKPLSFFFFNDVSYGLFTCEVYSVYSVDVNFSLPSLFIFYYLNSVEFYQFFSVSLEVTVQFLFSLLLM